MPRSHLYIILLALLAYALTSGVTLRDRLLIATLHRIEREALFEPSTKELFEGAMTGMANVLYDHYGDQNTTYIPPVEQAKYLDDMDNRFEGLGFSWNTHKEEGKRKLFVLHPIQHAPAYRAGLRSGDQILQINGVPIENQPHSELSSLLTQRQEIHMSVLPFGQKEAQDFLIRRERISMDSVVGDHFYSGKRVFHLETHPQIGYIRITLFSPTTAIEFRNALDSMMESGVEAFILDLRDNFGGDMSNSIQVAQMLMSPADTGDVIVTVRPRSGFEHHRRLITGMQRVTLPMVVLIDGETASASELLAAALQDHGRATIVGTRSFGKGSIQNIAVLPFQSGMLQLTFSEYRRPSGAGIQRRPNAAEEDEWGVVPDNIVEFSPTERSAVTQFRSLRANVIAAERLAVLEHFRQQIIEVRSDGFEFTGNAPYFDAQLDEAIRILTTR